MLKPGMNVRRSGWTDCVVEVEDVGSKTFWGKIVEVKTGRIFLLNYIAPIDSDWHEVFSIEKILSNQN